MFFKSCLRYYSYHVWLKIGAGSVEDAEKNYLPFIDLHLKLTMDLVKQLPDHVKLHIFSTDYVVDSEIRSLYALSKKQMEDTLLFIKRPNTYIYRVGTLYGEWKKCFPSKLLHNASNKNLINLPVNRVKPTATKWLAKILVDLQFTSKYDHLKPFTILDVAPKGDISIYELGKLLLPYYVTSTYKYDLKRPSECKLNSFFEDSWEDIWHQNNIWTKDETK